MMEAYRETVLRLYTRYPYEQDSQPAHPDGAREYEPGYVHILEGDEQEPPGQRLSGSATLDSAYLGGTAARVGFDTHLMVRRFGFALDFSPHLETKPLDALMLGSASLMFAPVLRPRWQLYGGVGVGVMIDGRVVHPEERQDAAGPNGTLRTAVMPYRPLVFRGRIDFGRLGGAPTLLTRFTAGVMLNRIEVFAGYERRSVGDAVLRGPATGLRVWF